MKKLIFLGLLAFGAFKTNAQNTFPYPASGNIGLGTNIPGAQLHLVTTGTLPFKVERKNAPATNQDNQLDIFFTSNASSTIQVGGGSAIFRMSNPYNISDMVFMPTPSSVGLIIKKNGNIGMGTTNPLQKLHVHDGLIMVSGKSPFGGPMIVFSDNIAPSAYPNGRWGIEYLAASKGLNFWQPFNPTTGGGGNYYMFLNDNGKIGMNIDPTVTNAFPGTYRLYVKDGILTEKIKVAVYGSLNWADYVFNSDYKLRPLQEVEDFVKQNKHLPGLPSAQQMVKEGNDLGATDVKLLEKIEELTLYMIELNKKVSKLEAENNALKPVVTNKQ